MHGALNGSADPSPPLHCQVLPKEEYSVWLEQRQQAEVALEGREKLLFDSALEIEKNLELLGKKIL